MAVLKITVLRIIVVFSLIVIITITSKLTYKSLSVNTGASNHVPAGYQRKQFKWSNNNVDGNGNDNVDNSVKICRNTVQGQSYITDDRGICVRGCG